MAIEYMSYMADQFAADLTWVGDMSMNEYLEDFKNLMEEDTGSQKTTHITVDFEDIIADDACLDDVYEDSSSFQKFKDNVECNGILQPLMVRRNGNQYKLIDGHWRYAAAEELCLMTIPVYIIDDEIAAEIDKENIKSFPEKARFIDNKCWACINCSPEGVCGIGQSQTHLCEKFEEVML